jgi:trk system potassium uptake protein
VRSVLIIGLGNFGWYLAIRLMDLGMEVLVVDKNVDAIIKIAPQVTRAQAGDCMDVVILKSIGVGNFDACFVCISNDFQSSVEITSNLKEMGANFILAQADSDLHAKSLLRIGANEIIFPDRDMALLTADEFKKRVG